MSKLANEIKDLFVQRGWTLAVAESCTGGAISTAITSEPGVSEFFKGSVVSYAESAKASVLGVKKTSLATHGAVSLPVALQMAKGVREEMKSTWAVSTTGYAGPDGGSESYPVGSVCVGVAGPGFEWRGWRVCESSNREEFMEEAANWALTQLLEKAKH